MILGPGGRKAQGIKLARRSNAMPLSLPAPDVPSAVVLGHPAPRSVRFGNGQGVLAAFGEHRAVLADAFGVRFAPRPVPTTLPSGEKNNDDSTFRHDPRMRQSRRSRSTGSPVRGVSSRREAGTVLGARGDIQVIGSVSLISLTGICAADLSPR